MRVEVIEHPGIPGSEMGWFNIPCSHPAAQSLVVATWLCLWRCHSHPLCGKLSSIATRKSFRWTWIEACERQRPACFRFDSDGLRGSFKRRLDDKANASLTVLFTSDLPSMVGSKSPVVDMNGHPRSNATQCAAHDPRVGRDRIRLF